MTRKRHPAQTTFVNHDGDTWEVISLGATRHDGKVYAHLASTTRAIDGRNGLRPIQICDWIDPPP